jgi:hypothetical protein
MPPEIMKKYNESKVMTEYKTIRYSYSPRVISLPQKKIVIDYLKFKGWQVDLDRPHCTKLSKGEYKNVPPGHALLYELEAEMAK